MPQFDQIDFAEAPPIVAILRGLLPEEAASIGAALVAGGIRIIEVPLNSPRPLESIAILAERLGPDVLIGAGTVTRVDMVARVAEAGGRLIVAPDCDPAVIHAATARGLDVMPGVLTPTECFAAIKAGATRLKLFPAGSVTPDYLRALREVLPAEVGLWPVGSISAQNALAWLEAGAQGVGVGGSLFAPGMSADEVHDRARRLVESLRGV